MLALMGLNMLAVAGSRLVKPPAVQAASVDAAMVFGFFATFSTLVVLIYQHKMRSRIPLLVMCLAALSIYGFLEGTWALGFSLAALSASELVRWYTRKPNQNFKLLESRDHPASLYEPDSRVARMFGSR